MFVCYKAVHIDKEKKTWKFAWVLAKSKLSMCMTCIYVYIKGVQHYMSLSSVLRTAWQKNMQSAGPRVKCYCQSSMQVTCFLNAHGITTWPIWLITVFCYLLYHKYDHFVSSLRSYKVWEAAASKVFHPFKTVKSTLLNAYPVQTLTKREIEVLVPVAWPHCLYHLPLSVSCTTCYR